MSGVVKGVKKAFKKVTKFVKRYWKEIVIAAAVVFTAGAAMGAWGAAAGSSAAAGGAAAGSTAAAAAGGTAAAASGASGAILSGGTFASGATAGLAAGSGAAAAGAGLAAGGAAAGGITTLGTVSVTAPAAAGGLTTAQSIGLAAGAGAATGAPFSSAAAESIQPGSQTQKLDQPQQQGDTPGESIADTGNPNDVQVVEAGTEKGGFLAKTGTKVKEAWGGMSSFEKMMTLNTGVQMASALMGPKEGEGGFPLANQFYGRDTDGKGAGMAMDYDQAAGQFVPGGAQAQQAPPVGEMGQQASPSRQPQPFVTPQQAGAPAQSRNNERFLSANRGPDEDSLNRRMDFITEYRGGRNG